MSVSCHDEWHSLVELRVVVSVEKLYKKIGLSLFLVNIRLRILGHFSRHGKVSFIDCNFIYFYVLCRKYMSFFITSILLFGIAYCKDTAWTRAEGHVCICACVV